MYPIGDMLTRIRNAHLRSKLDVSMPSSNFKVQLANLLKDEGYISDFQVNDLGSNKKELTIQLKYFEDKPVIEKIRLVTRPGLRVYKKHYELPTVRGRLGIAVISTSKGLMSDRYARKNKLGGEVICTVE